MAQTMPREADIEPAAEHHPPDIASFVLRFTQDVWREAGGEPRVRWRGHIRHVQSDAEARFADFADAVAFIQRELAQLTMDSVTDDSAPHQARAIGDSFRLWERFATTYADLWAKAMAQTVEQSQAVRRHVGENLERSLHWWNPSTPPGAPAGPRRRPAEPPATDDAMLDSLHELRAQIEALAQHMERLEAMVAARRADRA